MNLTTKFNLRDEVLVSEINISGKVIAIFYRSEIEYLVRYFDDGKPQEVYFYESELKGIEHSQDT